MIRRATAGDLPAIAATVTAAFAPFVAVIGRRPAPMDADLPAALAAGQVWLAAEGQGVLVCFPEDGALMLDVLAVHPSAQGRGLGAQLVAQAEAEAARQGLLAVTLYTNVAMRGAQALYTRLGYAETARGPHEGFERIFYRKVL